MKNILISVLGSSPAVITETLYALIKKGRFPQEAHLFTTSHGKETFERLNVIETIRAMCNDYQQEPILLNNLEFHIAKNAHGEAIEDIRDEADQVAIADTITYVIRDIVGKDHDNTTAIDASIAGGRKSMSFYMGYIFSMFAREQDNLSHVLVDMVYEGTDFMYPTVDSKPLTFLYGDNKGKIKKVDGQPLDAKNAINAIELAEIPFIRLNNSLRDANDSFVYGGKLSYSECITAYQLSMKPENIELSVDSDRLLIEINGSEIPLSPEQLALYIAVLRDTISGDFQIFRSDWDNTWGTIEGRWIKELATFVNYDIEGEPIDNFENICDQFDDVYDNVRVSTATKNTVLKKGVTPSIFDRLIREIKEAIAEKTVGNTFRLCIPTPVSVNANDFHTELPEARKETKSKTDKRAAAYGLLLNPRQITLH
ncbi:CRISPR-associated ring nuclease Csm6 [Thalassotalea ponticola]|uniref:CRISPR-associated ring nuclease Csm6 n=1 Tax=Thalassotalea ponticola TaxID=1523392 RepID=UPI0025B28500|nr:CRISPR-associated ring nuclease Csm6 [Thalassotalea ponticola]MDN3651355.1 CRISPR-associated ring nuclease Csm6 [Thalassotalea ponticola]